MRGSVPNQQGFLEISVFDFKPYGVSRFRERHFRLFKNGRFFYWDKLGNFARGCFFLAARIPEKRENRSNRKHRNCARSYNNSFPIQ